MRAIVVIACAFVACVAAGTTIALAVYWKGRKVLRARRRNIALGTQEQALSRRASSSLHDRIIAYAERLTRLLFVGLTDPITPSVRSKRAGATRSGALFKERAQAAGCAKSITVSAFCEARTRFAIAGGLIGALVGALLSPVLVLALGASGALVGWLLPMMALRRATRIRAIDAERHLSEMLEVVALGLRSGMTFDRSFALYGIHFENDFARSCEKAYRSWSLGLMSREEALRDLAASYDCEQLSQIVDSIVRSLRFGSSLAGILEEASAQSRAAYRAAVEERVAKAPVKMMLPTGTLILPAMLLLVMGPILLELINGF